MGSIIKGIVISVVILGVMFGGYSMYKKKQMTEPTTGLVSTTGATNPVATNDQALDVSNQFLQLLLNMQNIKLDQTIFQDPTFQGLKDFSVTIVPRGNEGRTNPFAPVGQDGMQIPVTTTGPGATTTANGSTNIFAPTNTNTTSGGTTPLSGTTPTAPANGTAGGQVILPNDGALSGLTGGL